MKSGIREIVGKWKNSDFKSYLKADEQNYFHNLTIAV